MKVRVTYPFYDKHTGELYDVGRVLTFETERANEIVARGLGVGVEEKGKKEKPKAKASK